MRKQMLDREEQKRQEEKEMERLRQDQEIA